MKKSELYLLAFKIIGLLLFIYSINSLKELLLYMVLPMDNMNPSTITPVLFLGLAIQWAVASILVFKPTIILNRFQKNEQETETTLSISNSPYLLYKIGISLICITLIIVNLPEFITSFVKHTWSVQNDLISNRYDLTLLSTLGLRLIIPLVVLIFSKPISLYLSKSN